MEQLITYHKKGYGLKQIIFTYPLRFGNQENILFNTNHKRWKSFRIGKTLVEKDWHIEDQDIMK